MGSRRLVTTASAVRTNSTNTCHPVRDSRLRGETPFAGVQETVERSLLQVRRVSQERTGPAHGVATRGIDTDDVMPRLCEKTRSVRSGQGSEIDDAQIRSHSFTVRSGNSATVWRRVNTSSPSPLRTSSCCVT